MEKGINSSMHCDSLLNDPASMQRKSHNQTFMKNTKDINSTKLDEK